MTSANNSKHDFKNIAFSWYIRSGRDTHVVFGKIPQKSVSVEGLCTSKIDEKFQYDVIISANNVALTVFIFPEKMKTKWIKFFKDKQNMSVCALVIDDKCVKEVTG